MPRSDDAIAASRNFEAVKFSMTHKKDGYHLALVVQPNDVSPDIFTDYIGQRYMVVMVPVGDDEMPVVSEGRRKADRLMVTAHQLPKQPDFWRYLDGLPSSIGTVTTEKEAAEALRDYIGVASRSEIATNEEARRLLDGMIGEFEEWFKNTGKNRNT